MKYLKFLIVILILIVSYYVLFYFFGSSMSIDKDYLRINQMVICIQDSQIPCRWVNGLDSVYGTPVFNYVGPLPYYFAGGLFQLLPNYSLVLKIAHIAAGIALLLGLLKLSRRFFNSEQALVVSMLSVGWGEFISLQFDLSLGVIWTIAVLPILVISVFNLFKGGTLFNALILAGCYFVLITSQKESLLIFLGINLAVYFWLIFRLFKFKIILLYSLAAIAALTMSCFYWLPMVWERDLVYFDYSTREYLPKTTEKPPTNVMLERFVVLAGKTEVSNFKEGSKRIDFDVRTEDLTIVRLLTYYFPEWKATIDGRELKIDYENNYLGLMTVILGKGENHVRLELVDTPVRYLSNLISLVGWGIFILLVGFEVGRIRRWLLYYGKALGG